MTKIIARKAKAKKTTNQPKNPKKTKHRLS